MVVTDTRKILTIGRKQAIWLTGISGLLLLVVALWHYSDTRPQHTPAPSTNEQVAGDIIVRSFAGDDTASKGNYLVGLIRGNYHPYPTDPWTADTTSLCGQIEEYLHTAEGIRVLHDTSDVLSLRTNRDKYYVFDQYDEYYVIQKVEKIPQYRMVRGTLYQATGNGHFESVPDGYRSLTVTTFFADVSHSNDIYQIRVKRYNPDLTLQHDDVMVFRITAEPTQGNADYPTASRNQMLLPERGAR